MTENDPKPIPRKTPKKKGDGPSMREQILARKRAEAAANGPAAEEATEEPAAKPAAKKAAPKSSGRPARSGSGRSGARAGAKRGGDDADGGERKSKRTRRERPQKKKSPVPLIATGALVVLGGVLAFVFLGGGEEEPAAGSTETAAAGEGTDGAAAAGDAAAGDASAAESTDAADGPAGDAPAAADEAAAEAAEDTEAAAPKEKAKPAEPEPVDLSALEPFGKPEGATDEQWAKLQEDAAMFFDVDAGAAGGRARRRLEEAGKLAWPAILNEMIKLDPANPEDNEQGMLAQRALNAARGSQTSQAFDWRTPDDGVLSEKNLRYNRKLIKALYDSWAKVVEDPSHWERIDKAEAAAEAKADTEKKIEDEFEFDPSDLEGLDG